MAIYIRGRMLFFGWNALFGRTDKVPGQFFIGTSFFYILFIPLIPLGSYIVRYEDDHYFSGFKGVRIGFNIKSVLYAWGRFIAVYAIGLMLLLFFDGYVLNAGATSWIQSNGSLGLIIIGGAALALWVMRVTSRASNERAFELAQRAGFKEQLPA